MKFNFLQKQTSRREMLRDSVTLAGSALLAHLVPATLLRASAAGDHDAFSLFVRRHTATALRYCLLRLGHRQAAEDAAQESMLRLYEQVRRRQLPDEPLPWL